MNGTPIKQRLQHNYKLGYAMGMDDAKKEFVALCWTLDWSKILYNAIQSRKLSWNENPVKEWRNASDEVCGEFIKILKQQLKGKK